jgi:hypothetical protein
MSPPDKMNTSCCDDEQTRLGSEHTWHDSDGPTMAPVRRRADKGEPPPADFLQALLHALAAWPT